MARHAYDRSVLPVFDAAHGAATVDALGRVLRLGVVVLLVEEAVALAAVVAGPDRVRWMALVGGRGGGGLLWDVELPVTVVPPLLLLVTVPGAALAAASAVRVLRRVAGGVPHTGLSGWTVVGVVLSHLLAPGLVLATVAAWAGWGEVGALVAGIAPQVGSFVPLAVGVAVRERLDPWVWADPHSLRGRRARPRWARRTATSARARAVGSADIHGTGAGPGSR